VAPAEANTHLGYVTECRIARPKIATDHPRRPRTGRSARARPQQRGAIPLAADFDGEWPIHWVRHKPEAGTSGWYCWTGDLSSDPDSFVPLHQRHAIERIPELTEYLDLPPASRFLLTPDYVDVCEDSTLPDT